MAAMSSLLEPAALFCYREGDVNTTGWSNAHDLSPIGDAVLRIAVTRIASQQLAV